MLLIYDWPFLPVYILQQNLLFSTLILGSVFSDYFGFFRDNEQSDRIIVFNFYFLNFFCFCAVR